ncbi:MAG: site-specific integrase [SAR324 cluster bacterium]|nr:site-specific integrase [SAR324 cluster bacterium]
MDSVALISDKEANSALSPTIRKYRAASKSAETKRAIEKGWRAFVAWCREREARPFPCDPETLEAYLIHLAESGRKVSTIEQARYAINTRHKLAGLLAPGDSHQVKIALAGIRRSLGTRQRRSAAFTLDHVRLIRFRGDLKGLRDRALLMTAVCGGFRRSELAAMRAEDVEATPHGIRIFLARSKGDQEGEGVHVDIVRSTVSPRHCPVEALGRWLAASGLREGPLFPSLRRWNRISSKPLSAEGINLLVKWAAGQCGLDPAEFSGHSTRSGCATYLLDRGIAINVVADHLRHKSIDTTRRYDRNATARALTGVY